MWAPFWAYMVVVLYGCFNNLENFHFEIENDIHTNLEFYEESGYKHDLDLLSILH